MERDRLFTKSFFCILGANFLLFFAFYLLMPVLPFYLQECFHTSNGVVGIILSCYTVAALLVRPFAGYILDIFSRKPLYLFTYLLFTIIFGGYIVAASIAMVVFFRVIHGFAFGIVTVSGNTIVIDIMPASRRGEGLGYYGLANNIAMAIGPMVGLFLHDYFSFNIIFLFSIISGSVGLVLASQVKTKSLVANSNNAPVSLDRFLLVKGIPAGIALLMLSIPYGVTSTYIALYAKELNLSISSGLFFTFMAMGMMISRLFSGRLVDKGFITQVITVGIIDVVFCYFMLALCPLISSAFHPIINVVFLSIAFLVGAGFGIMFPAFNTLFVCLGKHNQRGTATSTYLTAWDVGIGIGLVCGGVISQKYSFSVVYILGTLLCIISLFFFCFYVVKHFNRNRIS